MNEFDSLRLLKINLIIINTITINVLFRFVLRPLYS